MIHELKCWPEYFEAILNNSKPFEVRRNDRNFKVGDFLRLREFQPDSFKHYGGLQNQLNHAGLYTGREVRKHISYIFRMDEFFSPDEFGIVVMGLSNLSVINPLEGQIINVNDK